MDGETPMAGWEPLGEGDRQFLSEDKMTKKKLLSLEMDFRLENSRASLNIGLRSSRLCVSVHVRVGRGESRMKSFCCVS